MDNPEKIVYERIDPCWSCPTTHARKLALRGQRRRLESRNGHRQGPAAMLANDADLVEINPLAWSEHRARLLVIGWCLDAKITFDDNADFRTRTGGDARPRRRGADEIEAGDTT